MPSATDEEEFEILNIRSTSGRNSNWNQVVRRVNGLLETYPTPTKMFIGGLGGCLTGFVSKKVGKSAASAVGGGIVLMQVAHKMGYIHIDTRRINRDARRLEERLIDEVQQNQSAIEHIINTSKNFIKNNTPYAIGFSAGFFLGLAS